MEPELVKTLFRPLVHLGKPRTRGLWLAGDWAWSFYERTSILFFLREKNILNKHPVHEILLKERMSRKWEILDTLLKTVLETAKV